MPVFKFDVDRFSEWCEIEQIRIIKLESDDSTGFFLKTAKCKLFFCEGSCKVISGLSHKTFSAGEIIDLKASNNNSIVITAMSPLVIVSVAGKWDDEIGNSGIFTLDKSNKPKNIGDQVDYQRNTDFDNHFHDCDEYWIIYRGKGKVVTEGKNYNVGPGDCVATRMGDHHDFPEVYEKIHGVYFETTLKGKKRLGHLWKHTHT